MAVEMVDENEEDRSTKRAREQPRGRATEEVVVVVENKPSTRGSKEQPRGRAMEEKEGGGGEGGEEGGEEGGRMEGRKEGRRKRRICQLREPKSSQNR